MTEPTPVTPIDAAPGDVADRLGAPVAPLPAGLLERLSASGATVVTDDAVRAEAGRDWWPIAIGWAVEGAVPQRPHAVVRPSSTEQVAAVLAACHDAGVAVTPAAGRSGVCGGAIPVYGGIALDMTADAGVRHVDEISLTADVRAGTFGPDLETALGAVGTGTRSVTGPSRWTCRPWVAGWPAAVPGSTRRATGRSRTWSSGSKSYWPTAVWCGPRAPRHGPPPART